MKSFSCLLLFMLSGLCVGCSIHPLPEDMSGVSTYTIVRQIRCETRQAVFDSALQWLTSEKVDPHSRAIGLEFDSGLRRIQTFGPAPFRGDVRKVIALFIDSGVAYHFELEGTENNDIGVQVNLLKPFTTSKFTMGIGAAADRQRQNTRLFWATDTFRSLLQLPDDYCFLEGHYNHVVEASFIYPMTGRIGVKRHVQDFIELALFANLTDPEGKKGPPTLTDQLEFETTISTKLTPKVEFSPVGTNLSVTDASVTGALKRKDRHKLTMSLAVGGPGAKLLGPVRSALFTPLVGSYATGSQARALEAVNQALTLKLFKQNIVIAP